MSDQTVIVDRLQVKRSPISGRRPPALAAGEEFVNLADRFRLIGDGVTPPISLPAYPLRPGIDDVPGLPEALAGRLAAAANLADLAAKDVARQNLGLANVNDTADADKPVSAAQGMAIAARLAAASNLADVADKAVARSNLGLGTAATQDSAAFASASALDRFPRKDAAAALNSVERTQLLNNIGAPYIAAQSVGSPGYRQWSDGLIEQWGLYNGAGDGTITFPVAFASAVVGVWGNISSLSDNSSGIAYTVSFTDYALASCIVRKRYIRPSEVGVAGEPVVWRALGY